MALVRVGLHLATPREHPPRAPFRVFILRGEGGVIALAERTPWGRALVEGGVIVASILLAFAIDAWWDGQQERSEEERVLVSLRDEFEAKRPALEAAAQVHELVLEAATRVLELTGPSPRLPPPTELDTLVQNLLRDWTYNDRRGALNAATGSGQLSIIRNEALRTTLAAWPGEVEDVEEEELKGRIEVRDHLAPFLRRTTAHPDSDFPPNYESLFSSREFDGLVRARLSTTRDILDDVYDLQSVLERLLTMLERELSDGP